MLTGDWFGGGHLWLHSPVREQSADHAADLFDLIDIPFPDLLEGPATFPEPIDGHPSTSSILGGGWLVDLGFSPGHSRVAFHDHLLRWSSGDGWVFETLGPPGREQQIKQALAQWESWLDQIATGSADDDQPAPASPAEFAAAPQAHLRHLAAVESAVDRIRRGDFYQANICTRLYSKINSDPYALFASMARQLRPRFGAYLEFGAHLESDTSEEHRSLLSFSPELFLSVRGRDVHTSPIKGTTPRAPAGTSHGEGSHPREGADELAASTKDAAENVMIVDLMRNDLSRVAETGSVEVPALLGIQPHPGVWHLVSTVRARLRGDVGSAALLRATFPPGSVTGAPKSGALTAIEELEDHPRGTYTGTIGLISSTGHTALNVAIRTFEVASGRIELGVGGGITVDSVPVREWQECLHKAVPLIAAASSKLASELERTRHSPVTDRARAGVFETLLITDGRIHRLAAHLARLARSCRELYAQDLPNGLTPQLHHAANQTSGRTALKVQVTPTPEGPLELIISTRTLGPRMLECDLVLGERSQGNWRHKWVDRAELDRAEQRAAPALPYFLGPDGTIAETSRGNLFVLDASGTISTPPQDDNLLPGITRTAVIDRLVRAGRTVTVRPLLVEELHQARAAWWTSSLNTGVAVRSVDGRALPLTRLPDFLS